MKVFIVTPSFNSSETIDRTIISVIFQAGDFEINYHVQDGGSTDGTLQILRNWQQRINNNDVPCLCRNISFTFASESDDGIYDALAKGFSKFNCVEHDWMGWINSDDLLHPGVFALLSAVDTQLGKTKVNWINGTTSVANDNLRVAWGDRPLNRYVIRNGMCDGVHWDFVQQEGTFFRYKLWRTLDLNKDFLSFKYAGDWNLWRKFAEVDDIYQVPWSLGTFFRRAGQISQAHRSKYDDEINQSVSVEDREKALTSMSGVDLNRTTLVTKYSDSRICFTESKMVMRHEFWFKKLQERSQSKQPENHVSTIQSATSLEGIITNVRIPPVSIMASNFFIHDDDWQFPAITEKHAFKMVSTLMPQFNNAVYLAFPWATLIDRIQNNVSSANMLLEKLMDFKKKLPSDKAIITVSQHILTLRYQKLFADVGVTHVFWSHAIKKQESFPDFPKIRILPFPLYPVQVSDSLQSYAVTDRNWLFSFVGAKSNSWYLTDVRNNIIELLSKDKRGLVIARQNWHYDKIVYDHQIKGISTGDKLVNDNASHEFRKIVSDSIFSLCPSGSGPNSIRLWESIGFGAIPVILADTYQPPGNMALWEEASVFCPETIEAIKALPDRLAELSNNQELLARKRHAMKQLWNLYGPDCFIYDIQKLLIELAGEKQSQAATLKNISFDNLLAASRKIEANQSVSAGALSTFLMGCSSRTMADPDGFIMLYSKDDQFRHAYNVAMNLGASKYVETMLRVLKQKNINLNTL